MGKYVKVVRTYPRWLAVHALAVPTVFFICDASYFLRFFVFNEILFVKVIWSIVNYKSKECYN